MWLKRIKCDFNYQVCTKGVDVDEQKLYYLAGYLARKAVMKNDCLSCKDVLLLTSADSRADSDEIRKFIDMRNYFNALVHSSWKFFKLIQIIEKKLSLAIQEKKFNPNIFFDTMNKLCNMTSNIPSLGCATHTENLTTFIIKFYVILRINFIWKDVNPNIVQNKNKPRAKERLKHEM